MLIINFNHFKNKINIYKIYIYNMTTENVFVFLKSESCKHCKDMNKIFDKITLKLKQVDPNVLIREIVVDKGELDLIDKNPKHLGIYTRWFPMFLAIPYNLWEWGLSNNKTNIDVNFKDGVQIFNGIWKNDKPEYTQIYSIKTYPDDNIAKWFKDSINNQEYIKVKNNNFKQNDLIKSFINQQPIIQPNPTPTPAATPAPVVATQQVINDNDKVDVCSALNIISRQEKTR
jgi:hypothetical protein